MASARTIAFYEKTAAQLLRQACPMDTVMDGRGRLELFRRHHLERTGVLKRGTVAVYRQSVRQAMKGFERDGVPANVADAAQDDILRALDQREGMPSELRTSSLKVEVPLFADIEKTFNFLRERTLKRAARADARGERIVSGKDRLDIIALLYLLCAPRLGIRPIELLGARRRGTDLFVNTAKVAGRHVRKIPLLGWSENHRSALDLLLALVPHEYGGEEYVLWRNALASKIARASVRASGVRMSLYFGRHTAIARWRELGLTAEHIRILAGHLGLKSQRIYGRGAGGIIRHWISDTERLAAAELVAARGNDADADEIANVTEGTLGKDAVQLFDEADRFFPPITNRPDTVDTGEADLWRQYKAKLDADADEALRLARRIAQRKGPVDRGGPGYG